MKKIKESANKTVLLKYLNSFCCIANAALFILAEILVHLNPKDFHSEQSTASVLCIAIALTAVIFSVYYLASAKTESLSAEIVFIVVNIFLCCFVFWEELEVQYSLALDTVRIFLSVFIILLNAAIIQFNAQKAEYVFHKKRILLKANGIANLVRGNLTALSSALIILYSRFADFDSLLPVLLSAAVIVLSCFLIKEQHWKMSGRYNEKTLINILFVLYYIYDIKKLLEEDLLYEQPVYFLNILLSMAIIALSLICIFDRFEFGPFEDKRGHLSFCADKALLPLSILLAVTVIANFVFCQKDDTLRRIPYYADYIYLVSGTAVVILALPLHFGKKIFPPVVMKTLIFVACLLCLTFGLITTPEQSYLRASCAFGFALAVCCAVSTVLGKSQKSPEQTETTVVTEENAESAE